jgi:periplasmic divalent cation tolerance protein
MDTRPVLVVTSCPTAHEGTDVAATLADALVSEKLAACITALPGAKSTYRWKGELCRDTEVVCLIKTSADRTEALLARLKALHPYEVPEAIVLPIEGGLPPYLAWLVSETRG